LSAVAGGLVVSRATNWLTDTTDDRTQLELLNLSANGLRSLLHVANAERLCSLTLGMARLRAQGLPNDPDSWKIDNNLLDSLQIEKPMPHLRSLRLSDNRLTQLDVGHLRALKTLYADRNRLTSLIRAERLEKLETLSLRQQSGKGL
jgi:Leucine-rich repeat (LRR) protein